MDAPGDISGGGVDDLGAAEQAVIQDMFGRPEKRGALKRGFKVMPRILPYLRPYRRYAILSVVLTLLLTALALAEPWPLAFVVDSVIGDKPSPGWVDAIFGSSVGALIALAVGATLLLVLFSGLMTVWNEYVTTSMDQKMVLDFRSDMFEHAQKLSLAFHDTESLGILMYRINNQASGMGQIVVALPTVAQSLLTLIGMAYISFTINPLLAALALGTTPFIIYSTTFYTDRIEPRLYRVRGLGAMNLAIVYESMAMMRVVLAFGTQKREYQRFRKQGEDWVGETIGLTVRQTAFKLAVQLITAGGTAAVIGVGAYQAVHGEISAGQLLVILSYIGQIYVPLEDLTTTITNFQQWFIGLLMSFDLMDRQPEVKEKRDARPLDRARGEVEFEHVNFGYETRPDVLKDVSLRIEPGRAVAIVGPTGAGKSTLVSLLPRFYDADEGAVRIDGHDVRDLKLADVRDQFSIVLQEPLLFSGSIANNIRYSKVDASEEEVIEAAKAANAHEFISALPKGYETPLGEGGAKISGGERQRIAVARAFLRDAPILILDEPTSSIDSRTEAVILEALERLMEGRTTILIAHRLSTLRSVDEVLAMDGGKVVQRGSHEELLEQPGLYQELWNAQTRASDGRPSRAQPETAGLEAQQEPAAATLEGRSVAGLAGDSRPKVVLLGMLTKIPVAGVAWLVGQYAAGLERLGFEVYYVEAHARTPSMFISGKHDDPTAWAVKTVARMARQFGLEDRWAFQALHENGRCYGMSAEQLDRLYRDSALIINMHGGTLPLPEHVATDRLVFLGTDPVDTELEVHRGDQGAIEFLDHHAAFFTWGLNYGNPDCKLPWARPYPFIPSPPPVVLDFWTNGVVPSGPFTTIGNWRQDFRNVRFDGRVYRWSKHQQFMKILDLPSRVQVPLELALSSYEDDDRRTLTDHGWRVRPGLELSRTLKDYRSYVVGSAGELSAAKEQNIHFRTGWFSERSAAYLAAGRPVVLQDTGFAGALPTGEGLFKFSEVDEAAEAIETIQADPRRHQRAARELAREYLAHDVVLGRMLDHVGLPFGKSRPPTDAAHPPVEPPTDFPLAEPLREDSPTPPVERISKRPIPAVWSTTLAPIVSIVMPVRDHLAATRLTVESVLAHSSDLPYELVLVDDASADPTRQYLEVLAARNRHVSLVRHDKPHGPVTACDRGLSESVGEYLVLVRSGTIVPPDWLGGLSEHLDEESIGMVVPATNRGSGSAALPAGYATYGEFVDFASSRREAFAGGGARDVDAVDLSCVALRRDVLSRIGALDADLENERPETVLPGRIREAGLRVACADDVFVHLLREASATTGNGHSESGNGAVAERIEAEVRRQIPSGSKVLAVSHAEGERLMLDALDALEMWHLPHPDDVELEQTPASDEDVIAGLEWLRERGAEYLVLPVTSSGWLDRFDGVRRHLDRYPRHSGDPETVVIYELSGGSGGERSEVGT